MTNDTTSARPRVLLTNAIHPDLMAELETQCDVVLAPDARPDTLKKLIADMDGLVVRSQLPPDLFDYAPRSLASIDTCLRESGWAAARPMADHSVELAGSRLGIVGVGAVGSRLAAVATGLGMQVRGLTRRPDNLPAGVTAADKQTLFAQSDVVVLSCPLNDQTRGLVDAATLALMKPSALLINAARGPVVDAQALVAALRAGKLGGAALDVHDPQPLNGDEAIFDCPNLLLTPHIAAITATSMQAMSRGSVDTLLAMLRGEHPSNVVNPDVFAA
jgi:D-3-phosphoglycerate dehydrogenase